MLCAVAPFRACCTALILCQGTGASMAVLWKIELVAVPLWPLCSPRKACLDVRGVCEHVVRVYACTSWVYVHRTAYGVVVKVLQCCRISCVTSATSATCAKAMQLKVSTFLASPGVCSVACICVL